jgi:hypothetical protein
MVSLGLFQMLGYRRVRRGDDGLVVDRQPS